MILDDLKKKLIVFAKENDTKRLSVLRYLLSLIQNKAIELRPLKQDLTDEVVFKIIKKQIKNRKEVIEIYEKAQRQDKINTEKEELAILEEFASLFPYELTDSVRQ